MQYMLSVHHRAGDAVPTADEMQAAFAAVDAFNAELQSKGAWVFACGLEDPASATVVDGRGGETVLTDGPFIEAREHLGGFWIVRADDLDAALEWARRASIACRNPVEVRPLQDDEDG